MCLKNSMVKSMMVFHGIKKSHAEAWIQKHLSLYGGLDWRVGALFKAKRDNPMEVVYAKSHKPVKWDNVKPAHEDEYTP